MDLPPSEQQQAHSRNARKHLSTLPSDAARTATVGLTTREKAQFLRRRTQPDRRDGSTAVVSRGACRTSSASRRAARGDLRPVGGRRLDVTGGEVGAFPLKFSLTFLLSQCEKNS